MPCPPPDPSRMQAYALVPEVLADADRRCMTAFGRSPLTPGRVVIDRRDGRAGTVLGPWRCARGVMLAVDYGAESYRCQWLKAVDPDATGHVPQPRRLYPTTGGGAFWHGGYEWLIWRHAKGAHSWDVVRVLPGGTKVDERAYALRKVRGRVGDAWTAGLLALDRARKVCPSPYTSDGPTG